MKVPMLDLKRQYAYLREELHQALEACFEHHRWILGPELEAFEKEVCRYLGIKHAIGVSSGTDALVLALRAMAIKTGAGQYFSEEDLIITTPFTFVATGEAILRCGATVLFVDVEEDSFNICPEAIEEALQEFDNVRGIIVVHLYGQSARMDRIKALADKHNLFIIEDCAQAFAAKWEDRYVGTVGDIGCFSFFPTKNLGGIGDGGMIVCQDPELAEIIRMLRNHGGKDKYDIHYIGYNARLDTIQAAVLRVMLRHIDEFIERRRQISLWYREGLKSIEAIEVPLEIKSAYHTYNQYTLKIKAGPKVRDRLKTYLEDKGISTMIYYPVLLSDMTAFANRFLLSSGGIEKAQRLTGEVISLPMCPWFKPGEIEYVVRQIANFFSGD